MNNLAEKLLNKNVKAMISGRKQTSPKEPNFHFDKVVSFFKRNYRVEVKIFIEDIKD